MPAPMSVPFGAQGELCFRPYFHAFGEFMLAQHISAHCHVSAPDRDSVDRPFRKVSPTQEAFWNAIKHPRWRGLLPNRINHTTENIIIRPCRGDIFNRNKPVAG